MKSEALNANQIEQFIQEGFTRIDHAFSSATARAAREILWKDTGCDPHDRTTWTKPVVRLGWYTQEPFIQAANSPGLHHIFDQLVGKDQWAPLTNMGTFPVRFPLPDDPGDAGWHVDASFPGEDPNNFMDWRINVRSRGRALLMLFLFSDVGEHDAPTRIRIGSHMDVAKVLEPAGDTGLSFMELAGKLDKLPERSKTLATGEAGTIYLCHPFLAHAAQPHQGTEPRFMAQPSLSLNGTLDLTRNQATPVAASIQIALRHSN